MARCCVAPLLVIPLLLLTGCASGAGGAGERSFLSRTVPGAPPATVLREAERLMRREFGAVRVDAAAGEIESRPSEFAATRNTGAASDLVGNASTLRQVAYFRVTPRGPDGSQARLRIDVERRDTRRGEAIAATRREGLSDAPGATPIERDAATTVVQNEVWTFVRRNRQLERALLAEIEDALGSTTETPAASPAAAEEPTPAAPAPAPMTPRP